MSPPASPPTTSVSASKSWSDSDKTPSSESDDGFDLYSLIRVTKAEARFFCPPLPKRCIIPDGSNEQSRGFTPPSDPSLKPACVTTPVDLPPDQMSYWCRHGHLPRNSKWTHDLEGRDLEELTDDRCTFSDEAFKSAHPDIHLPPVEGLYFYKHGCLPPGSTRTHDL